MKPICKEWSTFHGKKCLSELVDSSNFGKLSPIDQVKGVCFSGDKVILSVKGDGELILPGGGVEKGEKFEETLRRELIEEASLKLVDCGPSCYLKITKYSDPIRVSYFVRYWATVELLDKKVDDPDGKSVDRRVIPIEDFSKHIKDEKRRKMFEISLREYRKFASL